MYCEKEGSMNVREIALLAARVVEFLENELEDDEESDNADKIAILETARKVYEAKIDRDSLVAGLAIAFDNAKQRL